MMNLEEASSLIDRLRQLGVSIAIDDFGTGYSSLGYLRTLSFNLLKIDRSFVADLTIDAKARAVAERPHQSRPQAAAQSHRRGCRDSRATQLSGPFRL